MFSCYQSETISSLQSLWIHGFASNQRGDPHADFPSLLQQSPWQKPFKGKACFWLTVPRCGLSFQGNLRQELDSQDSQVLLPALSSSFSPRIQSTVRLPTSLTSSRNSLTDTPGGLFPWWFWILSSRQSKLTHKYVSLKEEDNLKTWKQYHYYIKTAITRL